ncbi:MAG TPA: zf-TFIIB domain-containing protein [Streptosporangiaceae bacterium]|jgi:uncharacterized Zn finger protein (UPF0148 family)|nr:zf-TFIIB domain-containing protein [Streptosporangiaceae bacterium]
MNTFLDTEPCPACGTPLHLTDTGTVVTQVCPACAWTRIWEPAAVTGGRR